VKRSFRLAALAVLLLGSVPAPTASAQLSADEVRRVVLQAANEASRQGLRAQIAVTDPEGRLLALFRMTGAPLTTRVAGTRGRGLEGLDVGADAAAVSKAGTGAFLSSGGNAFSTRTASFIVQDHFPPAIDFTPGGPLFGVQLSNLACTDVNGGLPLGFAGDAGGVPLYKGGRVVGGLGVEGDGSYGVDREPAAPDVSTEERAALAGAVGFAAPEPIRADAILADGVRLPFADSAVDQASAADSAGLFVVGPTAGGATSYLPISLGGRALETLAAFPIRRGAALTVEDVTRILAQAAQQAARTRAAIRQPLGSDARVSISVVDVDGSILGAVRTPDAPQFGFDVAVQKARTANFFSSAGAADELRRAGMAAFVTGEVPLDGTVALSSRAVGFLAQPFFPPGINGAAQGPFSLATSEWSPFNTGLHLELVREAIATGARGRCSTIAKLPNGITIFPGGLPLYKDGRLAGAIGISGDGVDQDDLIAAAGATGFEPPAERLSDRIVIRGVRLPYVKFPRHPEL